MHMLAIGSYLRTLREARSLTRAEVAARVNTSEQQLFRIEAGEIDTRGSMLLHLVDVVQGNADDLRRIVVNNLTTAEEGRALALEWLLRIEEPSTGLHTQTSSDTFSFLHLSFYEYMKQRTDLLSTDDLLEFMEEASHTLRERFKARTPARSTRRGPSPRRKQHVHFSVPEEDILDGNQAADEQFNVDK